MNRIDKKPKQLTQLFYNEHSGCPEILSKLNRPYCVVLLEVDNLTFAVPFRTNINHKYCYIFQNSTRSENSGLDFTKAVVITNVNYIGADTFIDNKEYTELVNKHAVIANRFAKFILNYKKWCTDPHYYRVEQLLTYSSLKYFHNELGINL